LSVNSQAGKDRNSQTWEFIKLVLWNGLGKNASSSTNCTFQKMLLVKKIFYVQECAKITEKVRLKTQLMAKMQNLYRIIFSAVNVNFTTELHNTITK
jgi:hypothetical protein